MATVNLGSIKFNWQGAYDGATAYAVDDVVSSSGSSYVCIAATTGNAPPNATYWELMSQAGTNGTDGTDLTTTLTTQGDIVYYNGSALARLGAGTSGDFLKTQGTGANPVWASAGGGLQSQQVFTSSGTYTKPSGINKIKVYVTGGGAGGGGGSANYNAGGGGGAGGTAIKIIDATSITTVAVTVGNPGTGATSINTDGNDGSSSSFGSYCTANGGAGGAYADKDNPANGRGGTATGGDINIYGGYGGRNAGGDGNDFRMVASGGSSFWGGGGSGAKPNQTHNTNANARDADVYGAGGGAGYYDTTTVFDAGSGKAGIVIVEEYK